MSDIIKFSFSKIETFLSCKAKYNYCYNIHLPRKEQIFHTFGTYLHKTLEEFHNYYINGGDEPFHIVMGRSYKKALEENGNGKKLTKELKAEGYGIICKYLAILAEQKANNTLPNVLSCEKPFKINLAENIMLNGAIDRIQLDADGVLHVGDYKTMNNKSYIKKDFFQLATYAYCCYLENPDIKKIRASYILLRYDFEYVTREFTVEELLQVKDKYLEHIEKILKEGDYAPTVTPLCKFCDYNEVCPNVKDDFRYNPAAVKFNGEVEWS